MTAETAAYAFEDLQPGMTASLGKTISEADILLFAGISCDTNPVHLNEEFASQTMFKGRIAHGMLSAALISAVFGTRMPGPGCIYIGQELRFKAPVRAGDTVNAHVEVTETVPEKKFVKFRTWCTVGDKTVLDGSATIMVPARG